MMFFQHFIFQTNLTTDLTCILSNPRHKKKKNKNIVMVMKHNSLTPEFIA